MGVGLPLSDDIYPTTLKRAGLVSRQEQHLDGVSLAPIFAQRPLSEVLDLHHSQKTAHFVIKTLFLVKWRNF